MRLAYERLTFTLGKRRASRLLRRFAREFADLLGKIAFRQGAFLVIGMNHGL